MPLFAIWVVQILEINFPWPGFNCSFYKQRGLLLRSEIENFKGFLFPDIEG